MPMEFINQNILLIGLVVVSGLALVFPLLVGSGAKDVNPATATLLINREDAQVIDVRETEEFAAGHLPDARNVPLAKLADRINEIERFKDKPVIVCCASGVRAGKACGELEKLGFAKVHNLAGGIGAWVGAGYPIRKGTRSR